MKSLLLSCLERRIVHPTDVAHRCGYAAARSGCVIKSAETSWAMRGRIFRCAVLPFAVCVLTVLSVVIVLIVCRLVPKVTHFHGRRPMDSEDRRWSSNGGFHRRNMWLSPHTTWDYHTTLPHPSTTLPLPRNLMKIIKVTIFRHKFASETKTMSTEPLSFWHIQHMACMYISFESHGPPHDPRSIIEDPVNFIRRVCIHFLTFDHDDMLWVCWW